MAQPRKKGQTRMNAPVATQTFDDVRHDWTREELRALFALPFSDLVFRAQTVHRHAFRRRTQVQISTLLSIKTGGCPEDCAYCPQSAHYETGVKASKLMDVDAVVADAKAAHDARRHALLHGRGLALAQGPRSRCRLRDGRRRSKRSAWKPASRSAC